jgi:hypothetical protein
MQRVGEVHGGLGVGEGGGGLAVCVVEDLEES